MQRAAQGYPEPAAGDLKDRGKVGILRLSCGDDGDEEVHVHWKAP